jgi:hypothetical protein
VGAVIAVCDGADCILMIEITGMGMTYYVKPKEMAKATADAAILHERFGVVAVEN